jgi:nucleoside-diphosphate-sugar epimerase
VHVNDVVRAIAAAIASAVEAEIVFVGHPRPVTAREILETVRQSVGRPALIVRIPQVITRVAAAGCDLVARGIHRPLPLNHWRYIELSAEGFVCSVERLRQRLGIVAAIGLGEGFAQTAGWYRQEGWIRR